MIGIIILNYRTYEETIKCVSKINEKRDENLHFYIVDNYSQDKSYEKLSELYKDDNTIDVIQTGDNRGYSFGNNIGIKKAISDRTDSILICNSDVEITSDAIESLHQELLKNNEIGMISPKIINKNNTEDLQLRPKFNYNIYMEESRLYRPSQKYYNKSSDIKESVYIHDGKICGCCFLIKAEAIKKINYMDERFFLYYEEDALAYRMSKAKYKMAFMKDISAIHWGQISTGLVDHSFSTYHSYISAMKILKYYAKEKDSTLKKMAFYLFLRYTLLGIKDRKYLEKAKDLHNDLKCIIKS